MPFMNKDDHSMEHEWDAGERSSACNQREIAALTKQVGELREAAQTAHARLAVLAMSDADALGAQTILGKALARPRSGPKETG